MTTYEFLNGKLIITENDGCTKIESSLERMTCPSCSQANCCNDCDGSQGADENNEETEEDVIDRQRYNAVLDGIESFLLGIVCSGISDIPKINQALQTTLDAVEYKFV